MIALLSQYTEQPTLFHVKNHKELHAVLTGIDLTGSYLLEVEGINLDVVKLFTKGSFASVKVAKVEIEYDNTIIVYQDDAELTSYIIDTIEGINSNLHIFDVEYDISQFKSKYALIKEHIEVSPLLDELAYLLSHILKSNYSFHQA